MSKKAELTGSHFPTIYLTVISLLQGIALSQLVPFVINYFKIYTTLPGSPWQDVRILPLAITLLIIFIVWHHYAIGIFFLRWFPNIIDTIIPFMVSIGQFFLISYLTVDDTIETINVKSWAVGFAIIMLSGSLAYFSAAIRLDPDLFANIMNRANAVAHCKRGKQFYGLSGIAIFIQGLFGAIIVLLHREELLLISFIIMMLYLIISEYLMLTHIKPHFIRSLDEYDVDVE